MASGKIGTLGLQQLDELLGTLGREGQQLGDDLFFVLNEFLYRFVFALPGFPWTAVVGFVQVDVHILHCREHEQSFCVDPG